MEGQFGEKRMNLIGIVSTCIIFALTLSMLTFFYGLGYRNYDQLIEMIGQELGGGLL
jgi:hypothetical protein